ncbi:MAG: hypothetical protein QM817_33515 [Archangium sp.]
MTFAELLTQWRTARHPSTSGLIEAIGSKIRHEPPKLPKLKGEATRAWLNGVQTEPPTHLSARLKQLTVFSSGNTSSSVLWPLFEAIARLPPDPRFATASVDSLVQFAQLHSQKLLRRLFDCVEQHGDASHAHRLDLELPWRVLTAGVETRGRRLVERMINTVITAPEISDQQRKQLLAQEWVVEKAGPPTDPLEAVYAAPHDRARKQVLADVLLERGEPRGEFISLQLQNASPRKQAQLLKKHQDEWLGPLSEIIDTRDAKPVFTDGFVSEVTVREVKRNQFLLAVDAKEWATVTRVRRGLQRLAPSMRGLRATGPIGQDVLEHWAKEKFELPSLEAVWLIGNPKDMAEVLQKTPRPLPVVTAAIPGYHATRELRNGLAELAKVPGLKRLRLGSFTVDVVPRLIREITLEWFPKTLEVIEYGDEDRQLRLERDGDGWALRLFDAEPPHVSSHWKDLLFGVRGMVPKRLEVNFSSGEGIADVADFTARLHDFRTQPSIRYDQSLPVW